LVFVGSWIGGTLAFRVWHGFTGIVFGSIVAACLSGAICSLQSRNVRTEINGLQAYQAQAFHHQITVMNCLTKIYLATDLIGHPSHEPCEICGSYKRSVYEEIGKIRSSVSRNVELLTGARKEDFMDMIQGTSEDQRVVHRT
jgi:hypothetical protein